MLRWLYDDAILLKENGRKKGCLCLLFCLVDALAKRDNSGERTNRNRTRYINYLKTKLKSIGIDESYRIEEKGDLINLSDIIYEYFRCNFVHEGDSREYKEYEIQIEYDQPTEFKFNGKILIDRINKKIIFKSDWLIDVLLIIVKKEI